MEHIRAGRNSSIQTDWPLIVTALRHAQETGEIVSGVPRVWPDGSPHWLAARIDPVFDLYPERNYVRIKTCGALSVCSPDEH